MTTLLATIPPPPFRTIELGPFTLHGYGLMLGLAIITAIALSDWLLRRHNVNTETYSTFALLTVAGGIVGARLYHVASEPVRYFENPADIPAIWHGGLGIYGGVAGGIITAFFLAPRFKLPRGLVADCVAPAVLLAQGIGRVGNYINQELFGRPFDGAWALEVEPNYRPDGYLDNAFFHPTFLYEAIGTVTLAAVFTALCLRWKSRPHGILFPLYIAAYSLVRIIVEPLRIDSAHELFGLRQNVWVAGALVLIGLTAAFIMWRRAKSTGKNTRIDVN